MSRCVLCSYSNPQVAVDHWKTASSCDWLRQCNTAGSGEEVEPILTFLWVNRCSSEPLDKKPYVFAGSSNLVWIQPNALHGVGHLRSFQHRLYMQKHKSLQMRVQSVSDLPRQQSWYVSALVSVCASVGCGCVAFPLCQQIRKAFIFAGCLSTTQKFITEQIGQDRVKHSVLMSDHISLNLRNRKSSCAELGQKSTDQRFQRPWLCVIH